MKYLAVVHKEENSDYGISFPDFPGCVSACEKIEDISKNACEALGLHIDGMIFDGLVLPKPTTMITLTDFNNISVIFIVNIMCCI